MPEEQVDIVKMLEERTDTDAREMQALARSKKVRAKAEWLPENAVRNRKAFFCKEEGGYLHRQIAAANPMNMMQNPDMMNNMVKQNLNSVVYMFMFQGIGSIFLGFITAQVPFPLGYKFKSMLQ